MTNPPKGLPRVLDSIQHLTEPTFSDFAEIYKLS